MFLSRIFRDRAQNKLNKQCLQNAHNGDFKKALELIAQGADVNYRGKTKEYGIISSWDVDMSLGHAAVKRGNFKALNVFLDKGMDVDIEAGGKPLIMYAIECRQEAMALTLLERGASTTYTRSDLETPLSLAEASGMRQFVQAVKARTASQTPKRNPSP